jgi:hypothetical protein
MALSSNRLNGFGLVELAATCLRRIPFDGRLIRKAKTQETLRPVATFAALPSISEIPFLGSCFPNSNLRELRVLRGEIEDHFSGAPLQRTRSDGQAFKRGRRGHRSPIRAIRVIGGSASPYPNTRETTALCELEVE